MTKTPEEIAREIAGKPEYGALGWAKMHNLTTEIRKAIQAERDEADRRVGEKEKAVRRLQDSNSDMAERHGELIRKAKREALEEAARMAERHGGFEIAAEIRALEADHAE